MYVLYILFEQNIISILNVKSKIKKTELIWCTFIAVVLSRDRVSS